MIDKLEFLIALAKTQHFGRAAEACDVTQPTLSAGIKQLEESLGVLLVNRGSRFRSFTPEGQRALEWARRIVADSRALRQEIRALTHGLVGHLRIAAVPTALPTVAQLSTPIRARYQRISFTILSRTSIDVLDMMENLEIDAGLTYLDNEPVGRVRAIPLYREQYCLITADAGLLASRRAAAWSDLAHVPLCLLTPDMQNRRIVDRYLRAAGVAPEAMLQSNSMIVLLTHVRSGSWATVMPSVLARTFASGDDLRVIPLVAEEPPPTIGLVYTRRDPLPPLTGALVDEARRLAQSLENENR